MKPHGGSDEEQQQQQQLEEDEASPEIQIPKDHEDSNSPVEESKADLFAQEKDE